MKTEYVIPHRRLRLALGLADGAITGGAAAILLAVLALGGRALVATKRLAFDGPWLGMSVGLLLLLVGAAAGAVLTRNKARKYVNGCFLGPRARVGALLIALVGPLLLGWFTRDAGPNEREAALARFLVLANEADQHLAKAEGALKQLHTKIQEALNSSKPAAYDLAKTLNDELPRHAERTEQYALKLADSRTRFKADPVRGNEPWVFVETTLPQYCESLVREVTRLIEGKPDGLQAKIDEVLPPATKVFDKKPIDNLLDELAKTGVDLGSLTPEATKKQLSDVLATIREENENAFKLATDTSAMMREAEKAYEKSKHTDISAFEKVRTEQVPKITQTLGRLQGVIAALRVRIHNAPMPAKPAALDMSPYTTELIKCRQLALQAELLRRTAEQQQRTDIEQDIAAKLGVWSAEIKAIEEQVAAAQKAWTDSKETDPAAVDLIAHHVPAQLKQKAEGWTQDIAKWEQQLQSIKVNDPGAPPWTAILLPHMALADAIFHLGIYGGGERTVARQIDKQIADGELPREGVMEDLFAKTASPAQRLALANAYEETLANSTMSTENRHTMQKRLTDLADKAKANLSELARRIYDKIKENPQIPCAELKQSLGGANPTPPDAVVKGEVHDVINALGGDAMTHHWYGCLAEVGIQGGGNK